MATTPDFPTVFDQLKAVLKPYEPRLSVTADDSEGYSLDSPKLGPNKKPMFFGAAVIKKNYDRTVWFSAQTKDPGVDANRDPSPSLKMTLTISSLTKRKSLDHAPRFRA